MIKTADPTNIKLELQQAPDYYFCPECRIHYATPREFCKLCGAHFINWRDLHAIFSREEEPVK